MPASTQPSPCEKLVSLIEKGDVAAFQSTLSSNTDLSPNDLVVLLHSACSFARKEMVEILLQKGVDINAQKGRGRNLSSVLASALSSNVPIAFIEFLLSKSPNQQTRDDALVYAASHGQLSEVQMLLANGAKEISTTSALYAAALRGHLQVMGVLLANAFNVNAQNDQGNTPLHAIVSRPGGDVEGGIDLLADAKATLNAENQQGDTPLIKAVRQNAHANTISKLITKMQANGITLNTCNKKGYSAFHEAAIWGNIPLMQLLLDLGKVDVNLPDAAGNTALHLIAPQKVNITHAKFLLEKGANSNATNNAGSTPLHSVGSVEMAEVLINSGANIIVENNAKATPAISAIERGDMRVAEYLVSKNADSQSGLNNLDSVLNVANLDGKGNTVLHKAAEYSGLVKSVLLALSKDKINTLINATNESGSTPLHLACTADAWHTVQRLLEHGSDPKIKDRDGSTAFDVALKGGSVYCIVVFLETKSASVEVTPDILNRWADDEGNSLVHKAVSCSYSRGIQVLAQHGANMNIPNLLTDSDAYIDGGAPLHLATMMGELECIKVLLDNGADINSTASNEKNTPLHLACYHKHPTCVAELLKRGADVTVTNENDEPILQYAEMGGSGECLSLIKKQLQNK